MAPRRSFISHLRDPVRGKPTVEKGLNKPSFKEKTHDQDVQRKTR